MEDIVRRSKPAEGRRASQPTKCKHCGDVVPEGGDIVAKGRLRFCGWGCLRLYAKEQIGKFLSS